MSNDLVQEFDDIFAGFITWIPILFRALVVFLIGWLVAVILRSITQGLLERLGLNKLIRRADEASFIRRMTSNPSRLIADLIYWIIIIITIILVIGVLDIPILVALSTAVLAYIPNILAAVVILLFAIIVSALVGGSVKRWMGDTITGKILSTVIPILIISIAGFAILEQLNIAPFIVISTYVALIGSVALAFALAFGLGGRETASRILDQAYRNSSRAYDQARSDIEKGKREAEKDVERVRKK